MEKGKTKRFLRISLILYIVILATVTVATLGWFIFDGNANIVAESGVKIKAGANLEISRWTAENGWSAYGSEIHITSEELDFSCPDITGGIVDGQMKYYYPKVLDDNDNVVDDTSFLQELDGTEGYYIELRVKFRTSVDMGVYFSSDSFVSPVDPFKTDSTYGNQTSTDYIAGAVRVSVSEVNSVDENSRITSETLKNVWVPNDHIELYYDNVTEQVGNQLVTTNKAFVNESGEREIFYRNAVEGDENYGSLLPYGYMGISDGNLVEYAWSHEQYYSKLVSVGTSGLVTPVTGSQPTIGNACELITFDASEGGKLIEKEVVIRIWFEGTDREADKALNGGDVTYQFSFIGVNKDDATQEMNNKLSSIKYNQNNTLSLGDTAATENDGILYSYNGIDWTLYNPSGNNANPLNGASTIYVKIKETTTNKEPAVRVLQIENA